MNHKGGKYIASGTYGCVYAPAIKCKGESTRRDGASKLMKKSEALKEITEQKKVDLIDPEFKYHLKPPHMCDIGEFDKETDNLLRDCKTHDLNHDYGHNHREALIRSQRRNGKLVLLQMENGGKSVDSVIPNLYHKTKEECKDFICGMKNLFKALVDFKKNEFVHLDIKGDNVLYDEKNNRFNYIDFGLSTNIDDFMKNREFLINSGYVYYPPYFNILYDVTQLDDERADRYIGRTIKLVNKASSFYKHYDKSYILDGSITPKYHELIDVLKTLRKPDVWGKEIKHKGKLYTPDHILHEYLSKVDMFSLGMLMVKIYCYSSKRKLTLYSVDKNVDAFYLSLQKLIRGMIDIYHNSRISPERAYAEFVNICELHESSKSSGAAAAASGSSIYIPSPPSSPKIPSSHEKQPIKSISTNSYTPFDSTKSKQISQVKSHTSPGSIDLTLSKSSKPAAAASGSDLKGGKKKKKKHSHKKKTLKKRDCPKSKHSRKNK
tara:strand:+ start:268 stop:1743 length:1476 start_codon:yes stop_codon:yes gene_type:complete